MAAQRRPERVLTLRELNRAALDRQLLLRRRRLPVLAALERLVGLQAQATEPPYLGLLARLDGYRPEQLSRLLERRQAVRATLMRGTIHVVTARDARWLRPLVQPVLARSLTGSPYARALQGVDQCDLETEGRRLLDAGPLTNIQLGEQLHRRWPDRDPKSLAYAVRTLVPTVQATPRGLWRRAGPAAQVSTEGWLGEPVDTTGTRSELVLRHLRAFGPATVADIQQWCGLSQLRDDVEALGPALRRYRAEDGAVLWDVAGARLPDGARPAPVRLLPQWDNLVISYADRARVIEPDRFGELFTVNGIFHACVLVDGFVRGLWSLQRDRRGAVLVVAPFEPLPDDVTPELRAEADRVLAVVAPEVERREVVVQSAGAG